jgi:hypothetical protein
MPNVLIRFLDRIIDYVDRWLEEKPARSHVEIPIEIIGDDDVTPVGALDHDTPAETPRAKRD